MSEVLDVRGLRCPWPVLRLARAFREIDDVVVLSDDPSASDEIKAFAGLKGWQVQNSDVEMRVTKRLR